MAIGRLGFYQHSCAHNQTQTIQQIQVISPGLAPVWSILRGCIRALLTQQQVLIAREGAVSAMMRKKTGAVNSDDFSDVF